ncbi:MAG TPA: response regulator transcription factor [Rhodanobacteraceae bacterium]|nr:response regulator transcription factor [Rhodanobacteraceae bacterium]
MRILVVEDDAAIANAVCHALQRAGHSIDHLADGRQALTALREHAFAMVVLDLGLPGAEGGEILHKLRSDADPVPVLVITARDELDQRVRALDLGADDYLVKPFALAEFEARVRALLRRRASQGVPLARIGDLSVDLAGRRALLNGDPVELTAREFGLLEALLLRRGRVTSREQLIETLCKWDETLSDNGLDIAVYRLRRKLAGSGVQLRTVRGLGYLLEDGPADDSQ